MSPPRRHDCRRRASRRLGPRPPAGSRPRAAQASRPIAAHRSCRLSRNPTCPAIDCIVQDARREGLRGVPDAQAVARVCGANTRHVHHPPRVDRAAPRPRRARSEHQRPQVQHEPRDSRRPPRSPCRAPRATPGSPHPAVDAPGGTHASSSAVHRIDPRSRTPAASAQLRLDFVQLGARGHDHDVGPGCAEHRLAASVVHPQPGRRTPPRGRSRVRPSCTLLAGCDQAADHRSTAGSAPAPGTPLTHAPHAVQDDPRRGGPAAIGSAQAPGFFWNSSTE